jgi:metal transporter CNNM
LVLQLLELTPTFTLELIGEEIYDEFDQQGAQGDPYKVPPVQEEKSRDSAPGTESSMPKAIPTLPVHMPTALRSLGGFSFLKARSTPPFPGEEIDLPGEAHALGIVYGSEDDKTRYLSDIPRPQSSTNAEMPESVDVANLQAPTIMVQKEVSSPALPNETTSVLSPAGVGTEGKAKVLPLPSSSRAAVSTPPLETVLLERKRRLVGTVSRPSSPAGSTVNLVVTGAPAASATPPARITHIKGSRFKSSPLGAVESGGSVTVEKINEVGPGAYDGEVKGGDE